MDSTADNVFLKTSGTGEGFLLIPNIFLDRLKNDKIKRTQVIKQSI